MDVGLFQIASYEILDGLDGTPILNDAIEKRAGMIMQDKANHALAAKSQFMERVTFFSACVCEYVLIRRGFDTIRPTLVFVTRLLKFERFIWRITGLFANDDPYVYR